MIENSSNLVTLLAMKPAAQECPRNLLGRLFCQKPDVGCKPEAGRKPENG
jgi:hypothetical protein